MTQLKLENMILELIDGQQDSNKYLTRGDLQSVVEALAQMVKIEGVE